MTESTTLIPNGNLASFVRKQTGENAMHCYQCGKCTAGCPVAYEMDMGPRQVMRAVQLGLKEQVLSSNTIWVCLQCHVCSARCPMNIDVARVMESLRLLAILEERPEAEKDVAVFNRVFLDIVKRHGRLQEFELGVLYNLRSGHLTANVGLLPQLLSRGKLHIKPDTIKEVSEVKALFERSGKETGKGLGTEVRK